MSEAEQARMQDRALLVRDRIGILQEQLSIIALSGSLSKDEKEALDDAYNHLERAYMRLGLAFG